MKEDISLYQYNRFFHNIRIMLQWVGCEYEGLFIKEWGKRGGGKKRVEYRRSFFVDDAS